MSGRMTKWAIELSEFDIKYRPRTSQKGQVLADFLVECHGSAEDMEAKFAHPTWEMFTDGASNVHGSGARIVLCSPEGVKVENSVRLEFAASNNVAEYEALVIGLELARNSVSSG